MDSFMGTILPWPISWAPNDWALCDGSLLPISQYQALFSLIGTTYGGNGTTNFALPDLRGRMPVGAGHGPGLTPRQLGQAYGAESAALSQSNLPAHTRTPRQPAGRWGRPPQALTDARP
jgi:microcystin-dependent protein